MPTRSFFPCYLLVVLLGITSAAAAQPQVLDLPDSRCTVQEVVGRLMFQSIERRGQIADQSLVVLENLRAVNEKAKDGKKPVGEQLSPADIEKFSRYSQQLQTMQLTSLMEGRRMRDLEGIKQMAMLADHEYRWGQKPKEGTDQAIYHAAYQVVKLVSTKLELTEPKTKQCTLEYALHNQALEPLAKLDPLLPQLETASRYYKALKAKYKTDQVDRAKLSPAERSKYDEFESNLYSPFRKNYGYLQDLQAIKVMANALELMHQANMQDIAMGGGTMNTVGKSIQRNVQNKVYDEPTQLAMGMWTKINEKIPSDDVKEFNKKPSN